MQSVRSYVYDDICDRSAETSVSMNSTRFNLMKTKIQGQIPAGTRTFLRLAFSIFLLLAPWVQMRVGQRCQYQFRQGPALRKRNPIIF